MTIFFDLDGPILDVSDRLYILYKNLLDNHGYEVLPKKEYWNLKQNKITEEIILHKTCNSNIIDEYTKKRMELIETIDYLKLDHVINGADKILSQLKIENELVLVTNRRYFDRLCWELQHFNLQKYFDKILVAPGGKEPWGVKTNLIAKSNFKLKNSVIIGDTEADILAGKNLDITTIAVLNGIRSFNCIKNLNPDYVCSSIVDIKSVIDQLNR